MKSITILALVLTIVSWTEAINDRRYYGSGIHDVNRYQLYDNRYNTLAQRNSKYGSIYYPFYSQALSRELQSPLHVNYGDSVAVPVTNTYPSVTYRAPVASIPTTTYRPVVYSTPTPYTVTKSPSAIYHRTVSDAAANIVKQDSSADEKNYHFAYETDNGIAAEQVGTNSNGAGGTRVSGFYEYIGDDGLKYRVDYIADENGFRASGPHLPRSAGTF